MSKNGIWGWVKMEKKDELFWKRLKLIFQLEHNRYNSLVLSAVAEKSKSRPKFLILGFLIPFYPARIPPATKSKIPKPARIQECFSSNSWSCLEFENRAKKFLKSRIYTLKFVKRSLYFSWTSNIIKNVEIYMTSKLNKEWYPLNLC